MAALEQLGMGLLMRAAVAVQVPQLRVLVALEAAGRVLLEPAMELLARPIQAAVAAAQGMPLVAVVPAVLAVLVL